MFRGSMNDKPMNAKRAYNGETAYFGRVPTKLESVTAINPKLDRP